MSVSKSDTRSNQNSSSHTLTNTSSIADSYNKSLYWTNTSNDVGNVKLNINSTGNPFDDKADGLPSITTILPVALALGSVSLVALLFAFKR